MTRPDLGEIRGQYPLLNEIDDDDLSRLDRIEWYRQTTAQKLHLETVADRLGVYLMPYRAGCTAVGQGLCTVIAAAELDASGMAAISDVETAFPDIALVAYERPIRRRH